MLIIDKNLNHLFNFTNQVALEQTFINFKFITYQSVNTNI